MNLLTAIGFNATPSSSTPPHLGPACLIFNFIFAYGLLSSRTLKQYWGIDHNVSPREDLTKYGETAVREGKITRSQLDMLKRNEAAHANAVENYTLLVGAIALSTVAGVERTTINTAALTYTVARIAYGIIYILVDRPMLSHLRGIAWWVGNLSCLTLLWKAGWLLSGE